MKIHGQFAIVIRGSVELTRKVRPDAWSGFNYLVDRLLVGEEVAEQEFQHYGVEIETKPGALRDPWERGSSPACQHNWIEVTTRNDSRRRWVCSNCDAELLKGR